MFLTEFTSPYGYNKQTGWRPSKAY